MTECRTFWEYVSIKYKKHPPSVDDFVEYDRNIYEVTILRNKAGIEMLVRRIDTKGNKQ